MSVEVAACAAAARVMGYPGLADIMSQQSLTPEAAASLLRRCSVARDGMSLAVIVLAASTVRWRAQRDGWDGETERLLALEALPDEAAFKEAASLAARIVAEHWGEIAAA